MANEEQLSILKQGFIVWNPWRKENPEEKIDLRKADLRDADLRATNLIKANLWGANFGGANLSDADLKGTDLREASLSEANLTRANLLGANLSRANLSRADFRGADFSRANLRGVNLIASKFSGAAIGATIFGSSDLSKAIGLENVVHIGPSSIATDTFIRSNGMIPEAFLRGCGLSDWEIEVVKLYNRDLSNEEINNIQYRMYDVRATQALQISPLFISYSHVDGTFVDKLENQLDAKGIRYWRDIHDMKSGRMETQIDRAIHQNPTVLLILSEHSINSDWIASEIRMARKLEKELNRDVLCPVALDSSWNPNIPENKGKTNAVPQRFMEQIMEYNILDFSAWREDSKFEAMFRRLIDGLELFYKG